MDSKHHESFDPYLKWLGIRDIDRPINHYRLLGIDLRESDPDVIATAADRQMSHVRRYQSGKQAKASQEILNELAVAKLVLLDPVRKAQYDAQFARETTGSPHRRNRWWFAIPAVLACLSAVAVALNRHRADDSEFAHHAASDNQPVVDKPSVIKPIEQPDAVNEFPIDESAAGIPPVADRVGHRETPEESAPVNETPPIIDEHPTPEPITEFVEINFPITPLPIPETPSAWNDVKLLISERDFVLAKEELRALKNEIRSPIDEESHQALFQIADLIEQFWHAVDAAFRGGIPPKTMLDYAGTPVTVQFVDGRIVLTEPNGAQIDYAAQPKKLPPVVAALLAQKTLEDHPDLHTILWAFWAFDQSGNAKLAKHHWQTAQHYGSGIEPRLQKAWDATPERDSRVAAEKRIEIPDQRDIEVLRRKIETTLGIERRRPPTDAPEKLRKYASLHREDPATQYVCHLQALDYATRAGRADLAIETLDHITGNYRVDDQVERLFWLKELSRKATDPRSAGLIARAALAAARQSIDVDNYTLAAKLNTIIARTAGRSDDRGLVKQSQDLADRVKILARTHREIVTAKQTLGLTPADEVANLRVGRFYCLAKGDFSEGLPYLAKSGDSELAILARDSLVPPASVEDRIEIANRWWDTAEALPAFERPQARQYAIHLYRMLQPETSGTLRDHVMSRLRSNN